MDKPDDAFMREYKSCGPRYVDCLHAEAVIDAVGLGDAAFFIEQEREAGRVLLQELFRLEHPVAPLGRDVNQLHAHFIELRFEWLQLSQPLAAVGSPGATQELDPNCALVEQSSQGKNALAIGRG